MKSGRIFHSLLALDVVLPDVSADVVDVDAAVRDAEPVLERESWTNCRSVVAVLVCLVSSDTMREIKA